MGTPQSSSMPVYLDRTGTALPHLVSVGCYVGPYQGAVIATIGSKSTYAAPVALLPLIWPRGSRDTMLWHRLSVMDPCRAFDSTYEIRSADPFLNLGSEPSDHATLIVSGSLRCNRQYCPHLRRYCSGTNGRSGTHNKRPTKCVRETSRNGSHFNMSQCSVSAM